LRVEKNPSNYSLAIKDHIIVLVPDAHISLSSRESKFSHRVAIAFPSRLVPAPTAVPAATPEEQH
jgi:hypothetical protein